MNELSQEFLIRVDALEGENRIHKLCEELNEAKTTKERVYIRMAIAAITRKTILEVEAILG